MESSDPHKMATPRPRAKPVRQSEGGNVTRVQGSVNLAVPPGHR